MLFRNSPSVYHERTVVLLCTPLSLSSPNNIHTQHVRVQTLHSVPERNITHTHTQTFIKFCSVLKTFFRYSHWFVPQGKTLEYVITCNTPVPVFFPHTKLPERNKHQYLHGAFIVYNKYFGHVVLYKYTCNTRYFPPQNYPRE